MLKTAPCYSKDNYYKFFQIDLRSKKVLDIGSSIGSFNKSRKFKSSFNTLSTAAEYITMDINPDSGADIIGDAHKLPFDKNKFDIIVANNVIEHFYNPSQAIEEMYRVLKPGGSVYFTIPFSYPIHEAPHDYVRFTKYGLEKLLENFSKLEILSRGGAFSTVSNVIFKLTHVFDSIKLGVAFRLLLFPFLWALVQLDRFDNSNAFVRVYYGRAQK